MWARRDQPGGTETCADHVTGKVCPTMAVKMRLRREGKKKQPFYRVVVADVRSPRDGRFIEDIGYYQPLHEPSTINIDRERALHWLRNGVQPSDAVKNLLRIQGIWEDFKPGDPGKDRSEKHAAKAAEAAKREAAAQAEAEKAAQERAAAEAAAKADAEAAAAAEAAEAGDDAAADAPTPVAEADDAVVEQAVEEDTQSDAQPAEETGALDPAAQEKPAEGEQP
jgi:small subunit ribosomal protein S16